MKKLLRYFVHFSTVITCLGGLLLLNDGELDIYAIWNVVSLIVASYLIEHK